MTVPELPGAPPRTSPLPVRTDGAGRPTGVTPRSRGVRPGAAWYVALQWLVSGALRAMAAIEVAGMERCPRTGGVLLVSNHVSTVDVPLIGAWCPRPVVFFGKSEVRHWPVINLIARFFGVIFVRRGQADRQAIREALASLAAGEVVCFFPEGHRNRGRGLLPAQPGIGLLARRSGAIVWPVAVTGTERIGQRLRPRVRLTGGEPFDAVAVAEAELGRRPSDAEIAGAIMRRIAALLPPEQRGVYA